MAAGNIHGLLPAGKSFQTKIILLMVPIVNVHSAHCEKNLILRFLPYGRHTFPLPTLKKRSFCRNRTVRSEARSK